MSLPRLSAKCEARSHCSEQNLLKVNVEFEIMICFYQMERGGQHKQHCIMYCHLLWVIISYYHMNLKK